MLLARQQRCAMSIHTLGPAGRNIVAILNEDYSQLSSSYKPKQPVAHHIDYQSEVVDYTKHKIDQRLSVYDPFVEPQLTIKA